MSRLGAEYHRINDVARAVKERVLLGTQEQVKLALDLIGAHRDTTRYVFSV